MLRFEAEPTRYRYQVAILHVTLGGTTWTCLEPGMAETEVNHRHLLTGVRLRRLLLGLVGWCRR